MQARDWSSRVGSINYVFDELLSNSLNQPELNLKYVGLDTKMSLHTQHTNLILTKPKI